MIGLPSHLCARVSLKICREAVAELLVGDEFHKHADIAQLVEREPSKLNVVGSRPTVRSISGVSAHHRPCAIEGTMGRNVLSRIQ